LPRILKILLFLIFFGIFFEAGLISSYTIVTSQAPNIGNLVNQQIQTVSDIFNFNFIELNPNLLKKDQLKIINTDDVAENLKNKSKLAGIDLATLYATKEGNSNDLLNVNIYAKGYKESVTNSGGQIIISPSQNYSIKASAKGKSTVNGVEINVNTIKIISIVKLYSNQ
jgi:hypothetical protein